MSRTLAIAVLATAGILLGSAGYTVMHGTRDDAKVVAWSPDVRWIGPAKPTYQAYFRHTFYIEATPESAWVRFSADSNFELYVNGQIVSRERSPTNHAKGLAGGLDSDVGQQLNESRYYRASMEPFVSPWKSPDWKLCVYEDIAKFLVPGRNVIAVLVSNTDTQPRLALEGAVEITPQRVVRLSTGMEGWNVNGSAENVGEITWYDPTYRDDHWSQAKKLSDVSEKIYSRLTATSVGRRPRGQWISGPATPSGEVWLRGQWNVSDVGAKSFVRAAANTMAAITINGLLIDDPTAVQQRSGRLLIYDTSNLLRAGPNEVAVRLKRPLADQQPGMDGTTPRFYLDGWVETDNEEVQSVFETGKEWVALGAPFSTWYQGDHQGQPAHVVGTKGLLELARAYRGDATQFDYVASAIDAAAWAMMGVVIVVAIAFLLKRYVIRHSAPSQEWWNAVAALLLPGMLVTVAVAVLAHRYRETGVSLILTDYRAAVFTLVGFAIATCLMVVAQRRADVHGKSFSKPSLAILATVTLLIIGLTWNEPFVLFSSIGMLAIGVLALPLATEANLKWFRLLARRLTSKREVAGALLVVIAAIGFYLRWRGLDFQDLWPDENTSLDAIRGILRTGGVPETTSGIWYTRSPVYHYATAGWLKIFGDTIFVARSFAVVWGSAIVVVAFLMTRQLTRRNGISLLVAAFIAVDQWLIVGSRLIRFYVLVEFCTLLCFYFFYKGFVDRERPIYRYLFFVPLILAMLSQEIMITLVPIFLLGFLMFYTPFRLREDWPLGLLFGLTLVMFFFDLFVFDVKCLTPSIALGTTTDSIAQPHLKYVTGFISSFFAGSARLHVLYSFFFFAGFVHSIVARDWRRIFIYASVLLYLAELTVLVRQISLRYTSPVHPLFMMSAVTGAFDVGRAFSSRLSEWSDSPRLVRAMTSLIVLAALVLGDEYPRLLFKQDERLVRATTEVTRYIRDHALDSDIVMSPISPPAAVELGGLDYFIAGNTLYFDIPYRDGNFVRDRWGGGVLISNPEAFTRAFENAERVWIYTDEPSEARLSPAMRFFLRTTGRPVMESYAATLRLWQRDRDPFPLVNRQGRTLGAY